MPDFTKALAAPIQLGNIAKDTQTNATAAATQAAPNAGQCLLVQGFIISASAAPAAAVEAQLQQGTGPTLVFPIEIPAAAFAPIVKDFGAHPIQLPEAAQAIMTVPALGAGVKCNVTLFTINSSI